MVQIGLRLFLVFATYGCCHPCFFCSGPKCDQHTVGEMEISQENKYHISPGICRDKTMEDKLIYISNVINKIITSVDHNYRLKSLDPTRLYKPITIQEKYPKFLS